MIEPRHCIRALCGYFGASCAVLLFLSCSCSRPVENTTKTWTVMGTFSGITVPRTDTASLPEYTGILKAVFKRLEGELSIYNAGSDVSRLNAQAGIASVSVSNHTTRVLEIAKHYAEVSDGCFDVTIAPLVRLWGFSGGKERHEVPALDVLAKSLELVGSNHLTLNADDGTAFLAREGMQVDLGGVAKGYAVDVAWNALTHSGAENAIIDLGGNMRCIGKPANAGTWRIGIRHPFQRDRIVGVVNLPSGMAVATSGHYERFVEINGKRYAHIIDPRTGSPVEGMAGVTVVSSSAVEADAMSTALFVLGVEGARATLPRVPDAHALLIPDEQPLRIHISSGLKPLFTPTPRFRDSVLDL